MHAISDNERPGPSPRREVLKKKAADLDDTMNDREEDVPILAAIQDQE